MMQSEFFGERREAVPLDPGAVLLRGFAREDAARLLAGVVLVEKATPFRNFGTPGGRRMSVAMTNCGDLGWVSDRSGYRYAPADPVRGERWPAMPAAFQDVARRAASAAGFGKFEPEACLINRYEPGARLTLHQDRDEETLAAPIVSVSLGLPANFLWGGATRSAQIRRIALFHGDVVVWGGPSRLHFHGVDPMVSGIHPLTGDLRYNLSFRHVAAA